MAIILSKDETKRVLASIQRYFSEELEEEIGEMRAVAVLDFFLKEIGPAVYNKAVGDAQTWFQERAGDLEGACYEKEFTFWKEPPTRKK